MLIKTPLNDLNLYTRVYLRVRVCAGMQKEFFNFSR